MPECPAADRTRRARYRRVRAALIHPRLPMAVLFFGCATGIGAGKARPLPAPPLVGSGKSGPHAVSFSTSFSGSVM